MFRSTSSESFPIVSCRETGKLESDAGISGRGTSYRVFARCDNRLRGRNVSDSDTSAILTVTSSGSGRASNRPDYSLWRLHEGRMNGVAVIGVPLRGLEHTDTGVHLGKPPKLRLRLIASSRITGYRSTVTGRPRYMSA